MKKIKAIQEIEKNKLKASSQAAQMVLGTLLDTTKLSVTFDQVIGLKKAKAAINEALILPSKRPDFFTGIRSPPKGKKLTKIRYFVVWSSRKWEDFIG